VITVSVTRVYPAPGQTVWTGFGLEEGSGDFIKFAHTTAYADTLLLLAQRQSGAATPPALKKEIRFGLRWLRKAWDPQHNAVYIQVGIGSGNKGGTFNGDHDVWRLPQRDDKLTGKANRYLRNRPVFATDAAPGQLAPNLAGRMAASFALAAQVDAQSHNGRAHPARARQELRVAAEIFSRAKTHNVRPRDVVTALPHAFYPESSWRDDIELRADLRHQLARGQQHAAKDPFRAGANYDDFDVASHTFGLMATAELLKHVTGTHRYDTFLTEQRNWVLGANPWGVSVIIGVGSQWARCPSTWSPTCPPVPTGTGHCCEAPSSTARTRPTCSPTDWASCSTTRPPARRTASMPTSRSAGTAANSSTTCGPGRPSSRRSTSRQRLHWHSAWLGDAAETEVRQSYRGVRREQ